MYTCERVEKGWKEWGWGANAFIIFGTNNSRIIFSCDEGMLMMKMKGKISEGWINAHFVIKTQMSDKNIIDDGKHEARNIQSHFEYLNCSTPFFMKSQIKSYFKIYKMEFKWKS